MKFKTRYNTDNIECNSCVGDRILNKYIPQVNKNGARVLVITDKVDGQDIIDSFADSCDINNIIKSMSVDTFNKLISDLENAKQFVDTTKIPNNVFDYQNFMLNIKARCDQLPVDLKQRFNNNANYFMMCCEKGTSVDICNDYFNSLHNLSLRQEKILNDFKEKSTLKGENVNA